MKGNIRDIVKSKRLGIARSIILVLITIIPLMLSFFIILNILLSGLGYSNELFFSFIDLIFGNGLLSLLLLLILSIAYQFCLWHQIVVLYDIANLILCWYDIYFDLGLSMNNLLCLYSILLGIALIIITIDLWRIRKINKRM